MKRIIALSSCAWKRSMFSKVRLSRPSPGTIMGGLALIVATSGVAVAAIPSGDGTITTCYLKPLTDAGATSQLVIKDPAKGPCPAGYTAVKLATTDASGKVANADKLDGSDSSAFASASDMAGVKSDITALKAKLSKVSYTDNGLNGKPTLRIDGANLQIVSGSGSTYGATNGLGNLVIGYNEDPGAQTGSHNLVVGPGHSFTSYGGLLAGKDNTITAPHASVSGGGFSTASEAYSSISGGLSNHAGGNYSSVSGGANNSASGLFSSVTGGQSNQASAPHSSILGGSDNTASGDWSSISGGRLNTASGDWASILGGINIVENTTYGTSP